MKTKNIYTNLYIFFEQLRIINMQPTSAIEFFAVLSKCGFLLHHSQESASIILILTTCFFGGMVANFDINVFIIARENSCKISRAPYGVLLISYNAGRAPYNVVRCPGISRCYHIQTPAGTRTICEHAREKP